MSQLPVIPLKNLASTFTHKSNVSAVEGLIVAVYPKKEGEGQYGPWVIQDITLSDGAGFEQKVAISDSKKILDDSAKGKRVRISSGYNKKNQLDGFKYEIKTGNDGKEYRKLLLGSWGKIEFLTGASEPANTNTSASGRSNTGGDTAPGGRNGAQVGNAINNATLMLAHGFIKPEGDALEQLESTAKAILEMADRLESYTPAKDSQVTETKMGWKYAKSPTKGKTLEEYQSEGKLGELFRWAFGNPSPPEDQRVFHANVLLAAAEFEVTPLSYIVEAGASPEGLEALIQRDLFKGASELTPDEWAKLYKNFDKAIAESKQLSESDVPF